MSLWDIAMIILAAFLINSGFYFIPYMLPRVDTTSLLIYQAFFNGVVLLLFLLPRQLWTPASLSSSHKID